MRHPRKLLWLLWLPLLPLLSQLGAVANADTIEIGRVVPDRERRARFAAWWQRVAVEEPTLAAARRSLRRQHRHWPNGVRTALCREAAELLASIDRRRLLAGPDYLAVLEIGRAVDELAGAASACRVRRYFEFGYRLELAEGALARLDAIRDRELGR